MLHSFVLFLSRSFSSYLVLSFQALFLWCCAGWAVFRLAGDVLHKPSFQLSGRGMQCIRLSPWPLWGATAPPHKNRITWCRRSLGIFEFPPATQMQHHFSQIFGRADEKINLFSWMDHCFQLAFSSVRLNIWDVCTAEYCWVPAAASEEKRRPNFLRPTLRSHWSCCNSWDKVLEYWNAFFILQPSRRPKDGNADAENSRLGHQAWLWTHCLAIPGRPSSWRTWNTTKGLLCSEGATRLYSWWLVLRRRWCWWGGCTTLRGWLHRTLWECRTAKRWRLARSLCVWGWWQLGRFLCWRCGWSGSPRWRLVCKTRAFWSWCLSTCCGVRKFPFLSNNFCPNELWDLVLTNLPT